MRRSVLLSAAILLLAAGLRLNAITYGLSDVCLTVPEEYWLFSSDQGTSLYNWNITPRGILESLNKEMPPAPLVSADTPPDERLFVRLAGAAAGLITVALVLRLARGLRADWWWLAGLLVAVMPQFVAADRWTTPYDTAPLALAASVFSLFMTKRVRLGWQRTVVKAIYTASSLSLLLIAPSLWWLTILLLLLRPQPNWRFILFFLLAGIVIFPALQTPELWLVAAAKWDVGTTAGCILVVILLVLWWLRSLARIYTRALIIAAVLMGAVGLIQDAQRVQPSTGEWELVRWLQNRIPDDAVIQFDFAVWKLVPVIACPVGADIEFQAQSMPVEFFDVRELAPPYYLVSDNGDTVSAMPYASQIGQNFWVGRGLEIPNPTDIDFGGFVHLLGHEVLTTETVPAGLVDIRIDYQFGANITPDVLAYAAYVHVTPKEDVFTNWANISDPFFAESGNTGSRRVMLNHHIRFSLPPTIPSGLYDVRFGIFNVYTGDRIGDELIFGELRVEDTN